MALTLYNSLTRKKEPFAPLDPGLVRMYVCGPTVYDRAHIGNARAVVVFDVLYRLLRERYGPEHVRYVRNITDIDDKIIAASRESGERVADLTERMTRLFHEDMAALDTLLPDLEPRASEHIPQMIAMVERLLAEGCAYIANGHVLFAVNAWPRYGELSKKNRAELIAGARVEVAPYKRDPADFVLWKPSPEDLPGWESPWGRGRPGWHIECSAMSEAHLGESFDIHGGGVDLIFPHHENELAQSVCAHEGRPFVRFWVHNGFLTVDGAKMSKSLGNFRTVRELLGQWTGEVIRLALLSTHYRDPLDWTEQKLEQALEILDRFYTALLLDKTSNASRSGPESGSANAVREALEDDLDTPFAVSKMHEITTEINSIADQTRRAILQKNLKACGNFIGLLQHDPQRWRHGRIRVVAGASIPLESLGAPPQEAEQKRIEEGEKRIAERIAERTEARREGRFAEADRIRAELAAEGIVLEDHPNRPTTWRTKH
jgi:cysteinyl-tRNA synthetase